MSHRQQRLGTIGPKVLPPRVALADYLWTLILGSALLNLGAIRLSAQGISSDSSIVEIVRVIKPSVVTLEIRGTDGAAIKTGTGFFISPDGKLITNEHVIEGASEIIVHTEGQREFRTTSVIGQSEEADLALLQTDAKDVGWLKQGSHEDIEAGSRIIVVGNPLGYSGTVSDGLVAAIRNEGGEIQITAPVSPGSSGSPVVGQDGLLLGVVTATRRGGQNLNFAIGLPTLKKFLGDPKLTLSGKPMPLAKADRQAARDTGQSMPKNTSSSPYSSNPWKTDISARVVVIRESSSWHVEWENEYGGPDPVEKSKRSADFAPKAFMPRLNPFYVALPYNDVAKGGQTKASAFAHIPWFKHRFSKPGHTVLKGQWVAIRCGIKVCYAQWEDCGPAGTDDVNYVFGNQRPLVEKEGGCGMGISPAVRDYFGLPDDAWTQKVSWRFVDSSEVPSGPWRLFGNKIFNAESPLDEKRLLQKRLDELRQMRNQYFRDHGFGPQVKQ